MSLATVILAIFAGSLTGLVLGLVGGGGSILAVPLLIWVVGVSSTHEAIGTASVAVALNAAIGLATHWRAGTVNWGCTMVFAAAGVIGAAIGAAIGKAVPGEPLLGLFGALMLAVGLLMLRPRQIRGSDEIRLSAANAPHLLPRLLITGFGVGIMAGFFGIGGGFLIVPGLILATGMATRNAIGSSLVGVTAFGTTTAASYAQSGLVLWPVAGLMLLGGAVGAAAGTVLGGRLGAMKGVLDRVFAGAVLIVGLQLVWHWAFG